MFVNLTHLRAFWLVAKSAGFSAAAAKMNVSQPTLTRHVRDLEQRHQVQLFQRKVHSIALTTEGEQLFSIAQELFEKADEAETFLRGHQLQEIRLSTVTTEVSPRIISILKRTMPRLRISASTAPSSKVFADLMENRCDIGVLTAPEHAEDITTLELGRYPLLAVLPDNHPLLDRDVISLDELEAEPIVTGTFQTQTRHKFEEIASQNRLKFNIVQEIDGIAMVLESVRNGAGIGIVGYTGMVESGKPTLRPILGCKHLLRVHLACKTRVRSSPVINNIFSSVGMHLHELAYEQLCAKREQA